MINAIINNKVERQYIRTNEDTLTSFIFEKLSYLPSTLFEYIINNSVVDTLPKIDFKTISEIIFWPHWSSTNTDNKNFVEPDVLLRFKDYDILVEAKRYDENQQDSAQWKKEIIAYENEYSTDNKTLIFIALGGIKNNKTEKLKISGKDYKIYKCKWSSILNSIRLKKRQFEQTSHMLDSNFTTNNILNDLITVFQLFGFSTADWFEIFEYEKGISEFGIKTFLNKEYLYE